MIFIGIFFGVMAVMSFAALVKVVDIFQLVPLLLVVIFVLCSVDKVILIDQHKIFYLKMLPLSELIQQTIKLWYFLIFS